MDHIPFLRAMRRSALQSSHRARGTLLLATVRTGSVVEVDGDDRPGKTQNGGRTLIRKKLWS